MRPRVCVLRADGINCHEETAHAFELAGGSPEHVHVNRLRENRQLLREFAILVIPGGFSYGDDIHSGRVLATELASFLQDELKEFVEKGGLILGICNGFQVLVALGLLPPGTLTDNDSGKFECRWVNLVVWKSVCVFTQGMEGSVITLPVAHGEGRFLFRTDEDMRISVQGGQWPCLYSSSIGKPTDAYPANPNGSCCSIAGICDSTGRVYGMMPHPERYVYKTQFENWRRVNHEKPHGRLIFENAIAVAR